MNEGRLLNISYHMGSQESVRKICEMKCKRNSEVQDICEAGRVKLHTFFSFVNS